MRFILFIYRKIRKINSKKGNAQATCKHGSMEFHMIKIDTRFAAEKWDCWSE